MDARRFWAIFALLTLVALVPLMVTDMPAYADYPNHLARARVLAHFNEEPFFAELWRPAWALLPNILTDVLLVGAAKILPITVAGRVVLALIILTIGAGLAATRRQAIGGYDALGYGGLLLAYGFPVQMGFLNFSLGTGLLLLLFALHLRLRSTDTKVYLAALIPAAIVLFLCHLMAFVLFGLVALVWEVGQADRDRLKTAISRLFALAALPAILFLRSPTNGQISQWEPSNLSAKLRAIPLTYISGDSSVDALFLVGTGMLVALLVLSRARWTRPALAVVLTLVGVFVLAPFGLGTTANLDNRIPYVVALFALALIVPGLRDPSRSKIAPVLGVLLIGHSLALGGLAWRRGKTLDSMRVQMATLPRGALLFNYLDVANPVWKFSSWNPPLPGAHTMALVDGDVFPSGLFMIPGQQPLLMKPGLEALYWARWGRGGDPVRLAAEIRRNLAPLPAEFRRRPRFLMICGPERPTAPFPVVAVGPRYAIYRLESN